MVTWIVPGLFLIGILAALVAQPSPAYGPMQHEKAYIVNMVVAASERHHPFPSYGLILRCEHGEYILTGVAMKSLWVNAHRGSPVMVEYHENLRTHQDEYVSVKLIGKPSPFNRMVSKNGVLMLVKDP